MVTILVTALLVADSLSTAHFAKCATLLAVLAKAEAPTLVDLHACFGDDDDGELKAYALTVCHTSCDSIISAGCASGFEEREKHDKTAPSALLTAAQHYLRTRGFLTGGTRIEWPERPAPEGMRRILVHTAKGPLTVEFLNDSEPIEQVYLPDGRSVFSAALPECPPKGKRTTDPQRGR
jgi:hypothetical protein